MTDLCTLPDMAWSERAATVDGVRERIITVLAVPYESDADIFEHGRQFVESFARGAFDGIEPRTGRVHANRDHDTTRLVGRAVKLQPHNKRGLVADIKVSETPLGDETIALARDGVLHPSIHFGVKPGDDEWSEQGRRRRVTRAFLDHVAFVPEPAYADAAVLGMRHLHHADPAAPTHPPPVLDMINYTASMPTPTPRLDEVLALMERCQLASPLTARRLDASP